MKGASDESALGALPGGSGKEEIPDEIGINDFAAGDMLARANQFARNAHGCSTGRKLGALKKRKRKGPDSPFPQETIGTNFNFRRSIVMPILGGLFDTEPMGDLNNTCCKSGVYTDYRVIGVMGALALANLLNISGPPQIDPTAIPKP